MTKKFWGCMPYLMLLALAVDFDQDFILIAQMIGIVAVALLGFLPLILQRNKRTSIT